MSKAGQVLLALSGVGMLVHLAIAGTVLTRARGASTRAPRGGPGASVLKPLSGVDDELEENLRSFVGQCTDGRPYEVLLGVRDVKDAAYPLAQEAARRWPHVFRVVVQQGAPGLNPKVNQLLTLERAARHELLIISDSNVRAPEGYLAGVVRAFEDPEVGLVTHPVAGVGERSLGSLLDNLQMTCGVGAGMIAAKRGGGRSVVVGKSMALRRADLARMGGFEAVKDLLAEDYVLGKLVRERLGKRVVVAPHCVIAVSTHKRVGDFYARYMRWSVIQRSLLSTPAYVAQLFLHPGPLALIGALLWPVPRALALAGAVAGLKGAYDLTVASAMRPLRLPWRMLLSLPLKDALLFAAWARGLVRRSVEWRGHRLRVGPGSSLLTHRACAARATSCRASDRGGHPAPADSGRRALVRIHLPAAGRRTRMS
ncbi:glycosyltransferase [Archangium violaceum]|uniref:glycosyltransferase n=1 Tax=Archangium violaceum TaxID=83451 RepID=UPI00193B0DC8|nr:glycosyltransferase [Archangium violaceum]QRK09866.1 glycosyltransferase [Archangium violaceum]